MPSDLPSLARRDRFVIDFLTSNLIDPSKLPLEKSKNLEKLDHLKLGL